MKKENIKSILALTITGLVCSTLIYIVLTITGGNV
jgi:hypothetical protein